MTPLLAVLLAVAGTAVQDAKEPPTVTPALRTVPEAVAIVRPRALEWAKDAALMKVTLRTVEAFDARPEKGMYSLIDLVYVSRAESKPGEARTRTWSFSTTEPALRAGEPAVAASGSAPLPGSLKNIAGTVLEGMRSRGMKFDRPLLELARVHGKAVWYTINPVPQVYIADGVTGRFLHRTGLTVQASMKAQTTQATSWKDAVSAVGRALKAWGVRNPLVSIIRGTGQQQTILRDRLCVATWEFTLLDGASDTGLYVVVANGAVALWARQAPPRDRSGLKSLSSWSLSGAAKKVASEKKVKDFLQRNRIFKVEFTLDPAGAKSGRALYRIMPQGGRQGLDLTLDRRGTVKEIAP